MLTSFPPYKERDPSQVLHEPNTVVITKSTTRKYFGEENAMGEMFNVFSFMRMIILLIACINFMNLSTARF